MEALAAYMWMPTPVPAAEPPLPAMVNSPSTKSMRLPSSGIGSGSQRSWSGVTGPWPKCSWKRGCAYGSNGPCIAAGRMRYSQLRRLAWRGAVNAVPVSCSAYRPWATFCGELRPAGSAPATASVANSLPNPDMYPVVTSLSCVRALGGLVGSSEHAAGPLVPLDGFEQGLEVALAEAFVALALDDLEEDRAERVLAEDLQQLALLGLGIGVDQDRVAAQ